jgi:hypothetical protein
VAEMRSEILISRWEGRGPTRYQVGDAYKPQAARLSSTARGRRRSGPACGRFANDNR